MYARAEDACARQAPQQPRTQPQATQAQQPPAQPDGRGGRGNQGHPPHWWMDPQLRQQLGITDTQSKLVEDIWQKSLPDLRKFRDQLIAMQDQVSKMILDGAPEASVTAQIEQTENTRAQANKARMGMIYRMYKVLNADQRAKVNVMFPLQDDHRDGRRGGPGSR
jgi:Spy/CpxP family protein refolding chaperone